MEFTLYYRGPLKANGNRKEKHALRRHFHEQLKLLWQQRPLSQFTWLWRPEPAPAPGGGVSMRSTLGRRVGAFEFAPLVAEAVNMVAELEITFLRPEAPGSIVAQGGDIDNRIKTLLDALRVPSGPSDLDPSESPQAGEQPFFCLLEDDKLVTSLAVRTDQLLESGRSPSEVVLLIRVRTKQLEVNMDTIGLA